MGFNEIGSLEVPTILHLPGNFQLVIGNDQNFGSILLGFWKVRFSNNFAERFWRKDRWVTPKLLQIFGSSNLCIKNPVIVFLPKGTGLYTVTKMIGGFCKNKLAAASVKSIKSVSSNFGLWSCSEVRKFMLGLQFLILLLLKQANVTIF